MSNFIMSSLEISPPLHYQGQSKAECSKIKNCAVIVLIEEHQKPHNWLTTINILSIHAVLEKNH